MTKRIRREIRRVAQSLPGLGPLVKANERLAADAERLVSEVAHLTAEREALELQLSLLRSDQQKQAEEGGRAAKLAEEMETYFAKLATQMETHHGAKLAEEMGTHFAKLAAQMETHYGAKLAEEMGTHFAKLATQMGTHFAKFATQMETHYGKSARAIETYYARLAGQLTISSSEISSSLRAALPSRAASSDGDPQRYLDLLEKALTGQLFEDQPISPWSDGYDPAVRMIGRDWPGKALTMIGAARMRNIRELTERVIDEGVPGDFLEAGVWRGGACIYMRGISAARGETQRRVWVADSFAGLPPPDPDAYPADEGDPHHQFHQLIVPLDEVKGNFARYGLLDEQVRFLPGWFADTLPQAPIAQLAILRLDGDMYSSTMQTLDALYDKVKPGGYVIVDDYILKGCRRATDDFRARSGIAEAIQDIDGAGVYWRKVR